MGLVLYPAASGGALQRQIFTSSGTFALPAGFGPDRPLWAKTTAVGGGGGGGQGFISGGGGAGAVVVRDIGYTGNITVTIGAGGTGGSESSNGGRGNPTIIGNLPTEPVNLIRNPFWKGLYGQLDSTGWSIANTGSINYNKGSYSTDINQFYRQRFFDIADSPNWNGRFKSDSGNTIWSTSGDANTVWTTEFITVTPGETLYMGVYKRTNSGNCQVTQYLEWYSAQNELLSVASQFSNTNTSTGDGKYTAETTVPLTGFTSGFVEKAVAKCKYRLTFRCPNTNEMINFFGCYLTRANHLWSTLANTYLPWEATGNTAYWTGAQYTSFTSQLLSTSMIAGTRGIIAGGGGGGGRAGDEGDGGWMHYRFGNGPGGHQGGFGSGWSTTGNNSTFTMGGDGGGAGGAPKRDILGFTNSTTPFAVSNTEPIGYNVSGTWRTMSWRVPTANLYSRWTAGNAGTSAINVTTWSSTEFRKWQIEGGRPHASGFSAGGPGCGYYKMESENPSRYHYNGIISHFREQPYGNGGAGSHTGNPNLNTTNQGYMDWSIYGDWPHNGDPGIAIFEYLA